MLMGDNIREEEQAKVDCLRAVNRMLREQNRVLTEALQFYADPQTYGKHGGSVNRVIADGGATAQAALTATSQPGGYDVPSL